MTINQGNKSLSARLSPLYDWGGGGEGEGEAILLAVSFKVSVIIFFPLPTIEVHSDDSRIESLSNTILKGLEII